MHDIQNEGIPNITGRIDAIRIYRYSGGVPHGAEGAFKRQTDKIGDALGRREADYAYMGVDAFSAQDGETKIDGTLKNDVYGKSDHVTTYNSAIQIWKRIS